jgi:formylglycine-generating enzyme required for sulfatase activity
LVLVPPGTFEMGVSLQDPEADLDGRNFANERAAQPLSIERPFYLGKYEVTREEWGRVMADDSSHTPESSRSPHRDRARHPVESVSWHDIQPFLSKTGMRLPTEAEWEYACRAGTKGPRYGKPRDVAEYGGGDGAKTVGTKRPNAFGLYDMLGNVWEWTADPPRATTGEPFESLRIVRGGGWNNEGTYFLRASVRPGAPIDARNPVLGFRVARDP